MKAKLSDFIYGSKWFLLPFYFGLIFIQILYAIKFVDNIIEISSHFSSLTENEMILAVLLLIDMAMIANLLRTIVTGSYYSFVDKTPSHLTEKVSSGYLKVKMSMSLVGISSIHLLQVFINSNDISEKEIIIKCSIHLIFVVSTVILACVEYLHEKSKTFTGEH